MYKEIRSRIASIAAVDVLQNAPIINIYACFCRPDSFVTDSTTYPSAWLAFQIVFEGQVPVKS